MTKVPNDLRKLAKFMEYVLGRRPDAFGLLPDPEGFVKIKTLLQALQGDPEWRHLRPAHLNTLVVTERPAPIEIQEDRVRACHRDRLPIVTAPTSLPKLLYTAIRRRAYPVVHAEGIRPAGTPHIVLSPDAGLAANIGRRSDSAPVILTVQVALSQAAGTRFRQYGEVLYLADFIPPETFSGPPLPKKKPETAQPTAEPAPPKSPGSFFPDMAAVDRQGARKTGRPRRDEAGWKKERRRARKEKSRQGY